TWSEKADRMVRMVFVGKVKDQQMREGNVFPPVAATMLRDYPEVEEATRLSVGGEPVVELNGKTFNEKNFAFVDPNFFDVFTIPFLDGDKHSALQRPGNAVITKTLASKFFGNENPIGKVLRLKNFNQEVKVAGIINEIPKASHFHFDMFLSLTEIPDAKSDSWMTSNYHTYLVLRDGYDYKKLEAKLPAAVEKYMGPQLKQSMGMTLKEFRANGNELGLYLQPLKDIHLHSDYVGEIEAGGNLKYVYIFGAIAVFMLLIACINFMNLSTASASKRAREVGIRKVMGSLKKQLVWQFLVESAIITFVALLLAIVFVEMAMPVFNQLSGKDLAFSFTASPWILPALAATGLVTAFIAGIYPAFVLSSFNPIKVLKGAVNNVKQGLSLRSGLVVFQFAISIILMVCTAVVYNQLSYIQNKSLGYNKEQVLLIPGAAELGNKAEVLKDLMRRDPRVVSFTSSGYLPAGPSWGNNFFLYENLSNEQVKTLRYEVDKNYLATLGMHLKEGRNFSDTYGTDSSAMIINETAAQKLGWTGNIIGRTLIHPNNDGTQDMYHVIGVVKDFHFRSLHEKISPLAMTMNRGGGQLIAKVNTSDLSALITTLGKGWESLKTDRPFYYTFLDEQFANTYKAEQNTGRVLGIFAGLTIFVACLGLFGLATYAVKQRNREIGIRKVLGATVSGIVVLLSKDFLKLVMIAFIIAAPVAWYLMHQWLHDFEYRVNIGWWIFVIAALVAILITIVTVGFRGLKAALENPTHVLKNE
ncbi:MAG: FtsX-like permease family protein, partial [Flavitalea sp.]